MEDVRELKKTLKQAKKNKRRKKIETSKLILLVLFICSIIFILFNMYISYMTGDTMVMQVIAEGLFKLLTVSIGFYYWKARSENIRKHNKRINKEEPETQDNNYSHY